MPRAPIGRNVAVKVCTLSRKVHRCYGFMALDWQTSERLLKTTIYPGPMFGREEVDGHDAVCFVL